MMIFCFTNFSGLVDEGQGLCKISKGIGTLNGHVLLKSPLRVDFCQQVEDRFLAKTCLPLVGRRTVFLG